MEKIAFLLLVLSSQVLLMRADEAGGHDPGDDVRRRTERYRSHCRKMSDPRRVEHASLFTENRIGRMLHNTRGNVAFCVPLKVGTGSWSRMMKRLYAQDVRKTGREEARKEFGEDFKPRDVRRLGKAKLQDDFGETQEEKEKFYRQARRVMVVRHPMERILSSYIFLFSDSAIHRDLSAKVRNNWLAHRKDPLKPRRGEIMYDITSKETLTFRQFVNFLTHCPEEFRDCMAYSTEGLAQHWQPYWRWCQPCQPGLEYDYVLELGPSLDAEQGWLFRQLRLNSTESLGRTNQALTGRPQEAETKRKYFGQLSRREIRELYQHYKMDHDLFGYSPEEYIQMGRDDDDERP